MYKTVATVYHYTKIHKMRLVVMHITKNPQWIRLSETDHKTDLHNNKLLSPAYKLYAFVH